MSQEASKMQRKKNSARDLPALDQHSLSADLLAVARARGSPTMKMSQSLPVTPVLTKNYTMATLRSASNSPHLCQPFAESLLYLEDDRKLYGQNLSRQATRPHTQDIVIFGGSPWEEIAQRPATSHLSGRKGGFANDRWQAGPANETRLLHSAAGIGMRRGGSGSLQPIEGRSPMGGRSPGSRSRSPRDKGIPAWPHEFEGHFPSLEANDQALAREFEERLKHARDTADKGGIDMKWSPREGGQGGEGVSGFEPGEDTTELEEQGIGAEELRGRLEQVLAGHASSADTPPTAVEESKGEGYVVKVKGGEEEKRKRKGKTQEKLIRPFDMAVVEEVYGDMLERAVELVGTKMGGCAHVIREAIRWYREVPVERLMEVRKEQWRRPHAAAFAELNDEMDRLRAEAAQATEAAAKAAEVQRKEEERAAEAAAKEAKARERLAVVEEESYNRQLRIANNVQETAVAKKMSAGQAAELLKVRGKLEKALEDQIADAARVRALEAEVEELKQKIVQLEEEVEEGERKLYGSKAMQRKKKIKERNKMIQEEVKKYNAMHTAWDTEVVRESKRMKNEVEDMNESLSTALEKVSPAEAAGVLETHMRPAAKFAAAARQPEADRLACITEMDKMIEGLAFTDKMADSDSDGELEEVEALQRKADLLAERLEAAEQGTRTKTKELGLRAAELETLRGMLAFMEEWKHHIDTVLENLKADANKAAEEALSKVTELQEEIKVMIRLQESLNQQILQLRGELKKKEEDRKEQQKRFEVLKVKVSEKEAMVAAVEARVRRMEKKEEQLKATVTSLQTEQGKLEDKVREKEVQIGALEKQVEAEEKKQAKHLKEIMVLETECADVKKKLGEVEDKHKEETDKMRIALRKTEEELDGTKREKYKAEKDAAKASAALKAQEKEGKEKLKTMEAQLKVQRQRGDRLEKSLAGAQEESAHMQEEVNSIKEELSRIQAMNQAVAQEIKMAKLRAVDAEERVSTLQASLDRLKRAEFEAQPDRELPKPSGANRRFSLSDFRGFLAPQQKPKDGELPDRDTFEPDFLAMQGVDWHHNSSAGDEQQELSPQWSGGVESTELQAPPALPPELPPALASAHLTGPRSLPPPDHPLPHLPAEEQTSRPASATGLTEPHKLTPLLGPWFPVAKGQGQGGGGLDGGLVMRGHAFAAYQRIPESGAGGKRGVRVKEVRKALRGYGHSEAEVQEFVGRADPRLEGFVSREAWVKEYERLLGRRGGAHKYPPRREVGVQASQDGALLAGEEEWEQGHPSSWHLPGRIVRPTPFGVMLEKKSEEIEQLKFEKKEIEAHTRRLMDTFSTISDDYEAKVQALQQELMGAKATREGVSIGVSATVLMVDQETESALGGGRVLVEEGGRGAGQGGAGRESVQVAYTLTRLADVVEEPAKKGGGKKAARSVVWLSKMIHAMLQDKCAADAVQQSNGLPLASLGAFVKEWLKNRFGVEGLVRQNILHLFEALAAHRQHSLLVDLVQEFCDARLSAAQLATFMRAYGALDEFLRSRGQDSAAVPRLIPLSKALEVGEGVVPWWEEPQRLRLHAALSAAAHRLSLPPRSPPRPEDTEPDWNVGGG